MKNTLSFLMLFCFMLHSSADETVVYDDRSGLSHWIVSDILQDKQGFIWLSTWNGLNRFDGYEFRRVSTCPGDGTDIQSEVIRSMVLDHDGNIICKTDNGYFMLDIRTYTLHEMDEKKARDYFRNHHHGIFTDTQKNMWQVQRYGISKTTHSHHPAYVLSGTEHVQARAFMCDNKRRWWLATKEDETVRLFDKSNRMLGFIGSDGRLHDSQTPFRQRPYCIMQTSGGDIWMGCKPGALLRLRERPDGSFDVKSIPAPDNDAAGNIIYHIAEDRHGRLWLATFGYGLRCVVNPSADNPRTVGVTNNHEKIRRILLTEKGNIVCATTNGVLLVKVNNKDIRKSQSRLLCRNGRLASSLADNATMDVTADGKGRIFIATEYKGLDMVDSEDALFSPQPEFTHFNTATSSLTSDACLAMRMKADNRMLVVSTDCIMEFCPDNNETVTYARNFWNAESHFSEERPLSLPDGSWLFGQEQGAYIATPHHLQSRGIVPPLYFTELRIENRKADLRISVLDTVTLMPDERNFSIAFAALDYGNNASIQYRYRINGAAWSHSSKERTLTFYDTNPGEYLIEVQSTDRYGRWIDNRRALTVIVVPRWYETWWAHALGWLLSLAVILGLSGAAMYMLRLRRQRRELLDRYMTLLSERTKADDTYGGEAAEGGDASATAEADVHGTLSESDQKFMHSIMRYIEENIGNSDANIDEMALVAATSSSNLNRRLRSLVGITAGQLLIDARMQRARQLLESSSDHERNIASVAYSCGYSDPRYFSRCFKQKYGMTPSEFRMRSPVRS